MSIEFAFGPGDSKSWYMESPSKWRTRNLPPAMRKMFSDSGDVARTHCVVLGANGSCLMAYKKKSNGRHAIFQKGLPERLRTWLVETDRKGVLVRDIENLKVSLGPNNNSWFASDGKGFVWHNLPQPLNQAIAKLRNSNGTFHTVPRVVALGLDDNYIMITEKNGGSWQLSNYPTLQIHINAFIATSDGKGGALKPIRNIWLGPHDTNDINWVYLNSSNEIEGEVLDEAVEDADAIISSIPPAGKLAARPAAKRNPSSFRAALLKVVVRGAMKGLNNNNNNNTNAAGGGGWTGGDGSVTNFSTNSHDNSSTFWHPIQSTASDPVQ